METEPSSLDWDVLLSRIESGRCTPFLGAGCCAGRIPLAATIAETWAQRYDYPLPDRRDLARVAQFLAVSKRDSMYPKERILKEFFTGITPPDVSRPDEVHGVLARLPLPVYITTNYDDSMVAALGRTVLGQGNKAPLTELCRWNRLLRDRPSVFDDESGFEPGAERPVVFHFHGHGGVAESLVLTEDDYLDFLIAVSKNPDLIPPRIQRAFSGTTLLFLGYSLADSSFRVVFRTLVGYLEKSLTRAHLSVQLLPASEHEQREEAKSYLDRYFGALNIQVYWGTCQEFALELHRRWADYRDGG